MSRAAAVAISVIVPGIALAVISACSDGGTSGGVADSGAHDASLADVAAPPDDAGSADASRDAVEELVVADVCCPAPWITLGVTVVALDLSNPDGAPLPGADFTSPLCPGVVMVSDGAGNVGGRVSKDVPFYGRLQASGYVPELAPEMEFDADSTGTRIEMLPALFEGFVPGFNADASAVLIEAVTTQADAGPCSSLDGITFTVPGQDGGQVTYFSTGSIPTPIPDAGATSTRGLAAITGLTGGGFVTPAASKPGCHVVFARGPFTGRLPLENGFVSLSPAYLTP